jgi:hypothetical protein
METFCLAIDEVKKCKERLMKCYFWLNMDEDILKQIKECLKCQVNKNNKFPSITPLQHPAVVAWR